MDLSEVTLFYISRPAQYKRHLGCQGDQGEEVHLDKEPGKSDISFFSGATRRPPSRISLHVPSKLKVVSVAPWPL